MKIGIHTKELEQERVDGTRVYLQELIKRFGEYDRANDFYLYHANAYNESLAFQQRENFHDRALRAFPLWTQTQCAKALWKDGVDVLWMPVQNMPRIRRKGMKTVVTIHDVAFLHFPDAFAADDLYKLKAHTQYAIEHADHVIAVSESTKQDILKNYPHVADDKISVVCHGFDAAKWQGGTDFSVVKKTFNIHSSYLLYVGAIQPRKNLVRLVHAFESLKKDNPDLQLVIAGGDAWLAEEFHEARRKSPVSADVICTGSVSHDDLVALIHHARAFVFPSLYEGFGIPILEAFACGTPVVTANNSSLREVAGDGASYCDAKSVESIERAIKNVLHDDTYREALVTRSQKQLEKFSWDKCAEQTLKIIHSLGR